MKKAMIFLVFIAVLMLIAVYAPLPVTSNLDFQVLYFADNSVLQGIPLYDRVGQTAWYAEALDIPPEEVFVLPFPYPPWYAIATLPLVFLPMQVAARMWFLLNVTMLVVSVWLFTDGWEPYKRLGSFVAVFFILPVLGGLYVGQYVFPAILGMALIVYSLKHEKSGLLAAGMALVTFKPHIGIFVLVIILIRLLTQRDEFSRRAFWFTTGAGLFLFMIGFLADRAWPLSYLRSVIEFRDVSQCGNCISLPLAVGEFIGVGFEGTTPLAGVIFLLVIVFFIGAKRRLGDEAVVAYFSCVPLLVNPYLQNYDFAFMLVPLFYLARTASSKMDWLWIVLLIVLPWAGLLTLQREGNPILLVCVLGMTSIILTGSSKGNKILST